MLIVVLVIVVVLVRCSAVVLVVFDVDFFFDPSAFFSRMLYLGLQFAYSFVLVPP